MFDDFQKAPALPSSWIPNNHRVVPQGLQHNMENYVCACMVMMNKNILCLSFGNNKTSVNLEKDCAPQHLNILHIFAIFPDTWALDTNLACRRMIHTNQKRIEKQQSHRHP